MDDATDQATARLRAFLDSAPQRPAGRPGEIVVRTVEDEKGSMSIAFLGPGPDVSDEELAVELRAWFEATDVFTEEE